MVGRNSEERAVPMPPSVVQYECPCSQFGYGPKQTLTVTTGVHSHCPNCGAGFTVPHNPTEAEKLQMERVMKEKRAEMKQGR